MNPLFIIFLALAERVNQHSLSFRQNWEVGAALQGSSHGSRDPLQQLGASLLRDVEAVLARRARSSHERRARRPLLHRLRQSLGRFVHSSSELEGALLQCRHGLSCLLMIRDVREYSAEDERSHKSKKNALKIAKDAAKDATEVEV